MTPRQLVLDLPVREARGRAEFFVSPANAEPLTFLDAWTTWPGGKCVLVGPEGAGKTHLAHVWASAAAAEIRAAADVTPDTVPDLARAERICLEDADAGGLDEAALFHLHNLLAERSGALLLTARTPPRDWGLGLADLQSRLFAAPVVQISPPDDPLLRAVLLKRFSDRQLRVSPDLIDWLLPRMERSLAAAGRVVETMDAVALADGRPITRGLAAQVLDTLGPDQ